MSLSCNYKAREAIWPSTIQEHLQFHNLGPIPQSHLLAIDSSGEMYLIHHIHPQAVCTFRSHADAITAWLITVEHLGLHLNLQAHRYTTT